MINEKVDGLFASWDSLDSPGCVLGVIAKGKIVYSRGYGIANLEHDIPISSKTVFRIASTSKQFTAMCIALLAEGGTIALDDDIRKYLPEMPVYESPVTIRHLIHHTSGLRDYLELMSLAGIREADFYTDDDVIDLLARQKELNFKPGDQYLYSNTGYLLLAWIVQRAGGQSLSVFAQENIFTPLGMKDTHFHDDHTMLVKNRATGYSPVGNGGYRINMTTLDMVGDGGVFTTLEDLFLWDQNFYHNRLGEGNQELIAQVLTPGRLNNGEELDYAFGLIVKDYNGLRMVGHGGAFVGFRAEMIRFPEQEFTVICLANLSSIGPSGLAIQVADIYLADHLKAKEGGRIESELVELPEKDLQDKVGLYYSYITGDLLGISMEEGKLIADKSGVKFALAPVSSTEFHSVEAPLSIEIQFERSVESESWSLQILMDGKKPDTLHGIEAISLAPDQLGLYAGDYYSEELQVVYRIVIEDGKLSIRHKKLPACPLQPVKKDTFTADDMVLYFTCDGMDRVAGFTLNVGRVKNLRFDRTD